MHRMPHHSDIDLVRLSLECAWPQTTDQLQLLKQAGEDLEASDVFVSLLCKVLVVGNLLNEGTRRGNAVGASHTPSPRNIMGSLIHQC